MIIVTGATGQLGSQIVDQLLQRVPPGEVGVSVRDTDRAADLAARSVRVRHGDFDAPESLAHAFEGATQVLLVSASTTGDSAVAHHVAAIDAAREAGAQRVLYTSHMGASSDSLFAPMPDHAATERYMSGSGMAFTSLRNGFYANTVPRLVGSAIETGELVAPADGPVSWTTHADLAEAAAIALTQEGRLDGITPPLTAAGAHDLGDIAGMLTQITGRSIRRVVADDEEFVSSLGAHVPEQQAQMLMGMFRASRRGEFATTDATLEGLIGRPTQEMYEYLTGAFG